MRRHLVLVRHAKSGWDDPTLPDHDRPLAPRGVNALPRLLDHLTAADRRPDLVLCSSARRTVDTLDGIRPIVPETARVRIDPAIYAASTGSLLAMLNRIDDAVGCAIVIGHNPGMQDLALLLSGGGDPDSRARLRAKFPTAAAATLSFEQPWTQLGSGTATIDELFTPRR